MIQKLINLLKEKYGITCHYIPRRRLSFIYRGFNFYYEKGKLRYYQYGSDGATFTKHTFNVTHKNMDEFVGELFNCCNDVEIKEVMERYHRSSSIERYRLGRLVSSRRTKMDLTMLT